MKNLKIELMKVIAGLATLKEFEVWLYKDSFVSENILKNEFVFSLLEINYSSKWSLYELKNITRTHFEKEEIQVEVISLLISNFLKNRNNDSMSLLFRSVNEMHDWNDDETVLFELNTLSYSLDEVEYGFQTEEGVIDELVKYSENLKEVLEGQDLSVKVRIFRDGILPSSKHLNATSDDGKNMVFEQDDSTKKWFEFWK